MPLLLHCLRFTAITLVLQLCVAQTSIAQDTRYVGDKLFVPIRSGAGGDYRILHKGVPSGTAITTFQRSPDDSWTEVETVGGTRGWMRSEFIQIDPPAAMRVAALEKQLTVLDADREKMRASLSTTASTAYEAGQTIDALQRELATTTEALTDIKRVSSAAITLDEQNRTLLQELESLRADKALLRLENLRLQDRLTNIQIIDGALAVLLGIIIAVFGPSLLPKKRRSTGWS